MLFPDLPLSIQLLLEHHSANPQKLFQDILIALQSKSDFQTSIDLNVSLSLILDIQDLLNKS